MRYLVSFLLLFAMPVTAQAAVKNIDVIADVVGSSPVEAQEMAVQYAKKRAFFLALSEQAGDKALPLATSLSEAQIESHIRGYELLRDKFDAANPNHYTAEYRVSVSDDLISRLLISDEPAKPQETSPLLLLPVLREGDSIKLWEEDNVWRSLWNGVALERGETLLIMPYGDPTDTTRVNSTTVLGLDFTALAPLATRYGAKEIVVIEARPQRDATPPRLEIVMRRIGDNGLNRSRGQTFEARNPQETVESLMPLAARTIAEELKEIAKNYQGETLRKLANANRVQLTANIRKAADWAQLHDKLQALPNVLVLNVQQVSLGEAKMELVYDTSEQMMRSIMKANGLFVEPLADGWLIVQP